MEHIEMSEAEKLMHSIRDLRNPWRASEALVMRNKWLLENDLGILYMDNNVRAFLDTEPASQRIHREEPYVSIYNLEKEAHSLSRSWYRVNVTGKFSGNCEGISGNPSEDVYSHYRGYQDLKYANKSKDGKEFSLGYQVGGMGGEESFYRYTTTNQWCANVLAAIIGK